MKHKRKKHVIGELRRQYLDMHPKPLRAKNAFVLFSASERPKLPAEIVGGASKMRELSKRWKNMAPEQKKTFRIAALPDEQRYSKEMSTWKKGYKEFHGQHTVKKPSTAFMFFRSQLHRDRKLAHQGKDGKHISLEAQEKWAMLTEKERAHYATLAKNDVARYDEEIKAKGHLLIPEASHHKLSVKIVPEAKDSTLLSGKHANATWFRHFEKLQESNIRKAQPRNISHLEMHAIARKMWDDLAFNERVRYKPSTT